MFAGSLRRGTQVNKTHGGFYMLRNSSKTASSFVLMAALIFSLSLAGIAAAQSNTSLGLGALVSNTTGTNNTAVGLNALFTNSTGSNNTATGVDSLVFNITGSNNTAAGVNGLFSNTTGGNNTATGLSALFSNTTGVNNTASGVPALVFNTTGFNNTAAESRHCCTTPRATTTRPVECKRWFSTPMDRHTQCSTVRKEADN
jgi:hypothetical protein